MNAKPVHVCAECYDLDCQIHNDSVRESQCQICLEVHPTMTDGNNCCKHLLSTEALNASHFAKEVKKKRDPTLEFPTNAITGGRDK